MKINSLVIILLTLSFLACNKDEKDTPPVTSSSISGKVALFDQSQTVVDNSNMTVTVEGSSPTLSAQTDASGNFTITDVPFGTYNLTFNKADYGTYKYFDITLTESGGASNITETINLGQISNTSFINKFSIRVVGENLEIIGAIDPEGTIENSKYVRMFYSTDENVSSTNYSSYSESYAVTSVNFELTITKEELIDEGFASGTTVYLKIYGDSYWNNSYEDPLSGKMVFPNLSANSPDIVSFIVP